MNRTNGFAWLMAGGLVVGTSVAAVGHGGATGIVAERMMGMMVLGEQIEILTPLLESDEAIDPAIMREAAGMIEMHAGSAMSELFPEGNLDTPSVARPEIWQRWQDFTGYSDRLAALGRELAAVADVRPPSEETGPDAVAEAPRLPEPSEWERMNFASLMGLPAPATVQPDAIDPVVTGSISSQSDAPARTAKAVVVDITETCSSCHAAFRR